MAWQCTACAGENLEGMRFCGHCGAPAQTGGSVAPAPPKGGVNRTLRSFVAGEVADRLVESGGELPQERRLITALFADVSGFTSLADRLDPEQLMEVIDPVIAALSSIVGRYGGYVEKFAGDALLALFGAPVSHEDDAERALRVALEMHRTVARLCLELPYQPELTLHVGINSGHGIARILGSDARMDYAVLGDSVILAQRLESAAPTGETYVSETTVRLTGDRFEFERVGDLTLKGKAEPVAAWRLVGERTTRAPSARHLIGREGELGVIIDTFSQLGDGRGAVVAVFGEAGMGKSRLTEEVSARAGEGGVSWRQTRCLSYGAGLPYWPYAELLRSSAGIGPEDAPDIARRRLHDAFSDAPQSVPYFARLLGLDADGADELATLEPEAFRRGLHDAFTAWISQAAASGPLVVAVEDLHWADASSVELTRDIAAVCGVAPVIVYLIARPEAEGVVAEIAPHATVVRLAPLGPEAVTDLLGTILGPSPPPQLAGFVHERTAGNPFFVEELVRALQETSVLVATEARWRLRPDWEPEEVPPTIEGVLSARIDALPRRSAAALQTAAVIGRRVRRQLLRAVEGDETGLDEALRQLVAAGLLDEGDDDQLVFHHALVQDVAYGRMLRRHRGALHRRVAEVAEAMYGSGDDVIELLARHLYLGEAGEKAVAYLVRAGERAQRLFANDEAIVHFGRAAEVSGRETTIVLSLADLQELVGAYEAAHDLYAEVRDATNDVRAWRGLAATLHKRGIYDRALAVVEEAFRTDALSGADLSPLWLEQGSVLASSGRYEQAIDVLSAGLTGASAPEVRGRMLLLLAHCKTHEGAVAGALAHAREAEETFTRHDDLRGLAHALRTVGGALFRLGQLDDAAVALRRSIQLAERVGSVDDIAGALINLGLVERERGALDDAIVCDRRAVEEFERVRNDAGRAIGYANLAEKLVDRGEYDEASDLLEQALELARKIGNLFTIADGTKTRATIDLRIGDARAAATRAEEAARLFLEIGAAPGAAEALRLAAEASAVAGDGERAREAESRARALSST